MPKKPEEIVFYPDGSIHVTLDGDKKIFRTLLQGHSPNTEIIESAKVKVDGTTIIIHSDSVNFQGAGIHAILEGMAKELCRLRSAIGDLRHRATILERRDEERARG